MFYINQEKKKFVNSVNQLTPNPITLEYAIDDIYLAFKIKDKNSKEIQLNNNDIFYLAVSTDFLPKTPIVYSSNFTIADNTVTFKVSTNTTQYVNDIQQNNSNVNIEIARKTANDESFHIVLQDFILANKRVYVAGQPNPVQLDAFYTKSQVDAELNRISNYINTNYFTKSETAQAIATANHLKIEVVNTLPDVSNATAYTVYFVPQNSSNSVNLRQQYMQSGGALPQYSGGTNNDVYDEYIVINNHWEHIGSTAVDLTGFVRNTDLNNFIFNSGLRIVSNGIAAPDAWDGERGEGCRLVLRAFQGEWSGLSIILQKKSQGDDDWTNYGIIFNVECNADGDVNYAMPDEYGDVINHRLSEVWDPDDWQGNGGGDEVECDNCGAHYNEEQNNHICPECSWVNHCPDCGQSFNFGQVGECPNCGWGGGHEDQGWYEECPDCGANVNRDDTDYCPDCGHYFGDQDQGEECPNCHQHSVQFNGDFNECSSCGWSEQWSECQDCGTWFNGDDNSGVCPNCGWSENGGDQGGDQGDNCPECAAPLDGAHHCDFCGWNENGEAGICPDCGSELSEDENGLYCEMCDWRAPQGE